MRNASYSVFMLGIPIAVFLLISSARATDTDGDGLFDVIDMTGFDPTESSIDLSGRGIEDLDGLNLLTNAQVLNLNFNRVSSIERGDFDGLNILLELELANNQITRIENGAFEGLNNLKEIWLHGNPITSIENGAFEGLTNLLGLVIWEQETLNLTGAMFENLATCEAFGGFCVGGRLESLILDDAALSLGSFNVVVSETNSITDVSLIGMTFSDEIPTDLDNLLGNSTLKNVTVDHVLFDLYADEFDDFAAIDGNMVTVVAGRCDINRDGVCDANDIDVMMTMVLADTATQGQLTGLITRPSPSGFNTFFGDANLDGVFNGHDFVVVFTAGEYEDGISVNSGWAEGDWNGDGEFDSGDLVAAFQDEGYEQGPRDTANAVPEPTLIVFLFTGFVGIALRQRSVRR